MSINWRIILALGLVVYLVNVPAAEPSLTNMYWRAVSVTDQKLSLAPEIIPHIAFHEEEGRVAGFGGCNRFFATYEHHDRALTIRVMGGGRAQCPELNGLESRFLSSLQSTQRFSIENKTLKLANETGVLIEFVGVER